MKRTVVFDQVARHLPAIVVLSETHATVGRLYTLKRKWASFEYHAYFSSYARGVSVYIHGGMEFLPVDNVIDKEGRFVFLHGYWKGQEIIMVFIYIPPPYKSTVFSLLSKYPATKNPCP